MQLNIVFAILGLCAAVVQNEATPSQNTQVSLLASSLTQTETNSFGLELYEHGFVDDASDTNLNQRGYKFLCDYNQAIHFPVAANEVHIEKAFRDFLTVKKLNMWIHIVLGAVSVFMAIQALLKIMQLFKKKKTLETPKTLETLENVPTDLENALQKVKTELHKYIWIVAGHVLHAAYQTVVACCYTSIWSLITGGNRKVGSFLDSALNIALAGLIVYTLWDLLWKWDKSYAEVSLEVFGWIIAVQIVFWVIFGAIPLFVSIC